MAKKKSPLFDQWNAKHGKKENPFDPEYYTKEIHRFSPVPYEKEGVLVKMVDEMFGRVDGLCYRDFRSLKSFPTFHIDKTLWMSITPMEAETHYIPIALASDKNVKTVAVGGLGLGYYVARIMSLSNLNKIVVYEKEQRVVDYFIECYGSREGFDKIEFVVGDIYEKFVNQTFDFCYMDIYETVAHHKAVDDRSEFLFKNKLKNYWFWTEEKMHFYLIANREFDDSFTNNSKLVMELFRMFLTSDKANRFDVGYGYKSEEIEKYEETTINFFD